MNLSGAITYNGWTNTLTRAAGGVPADGWEIIRADISPIGVTQYLDKKALQDGMDAYDVYENARQVNLVVGVYGSTKGSFWDNLQTFLAAFNPVLAYNADTANLGFLSLAFYQPTAITGTWSTASYPNGIPMQLYCRPSAPPSYDIPKAATSGDANKGLATNATLQLICRDPRKYLQTQASQVVTLSANTATNRGDYPTWPIFTFSLSASGNSSLTLTVGGGSVFIDMSSKSTGTFTMDFAKRMLTDSNGTNLNGLITGNTVFSQVQPGQVTTYSMTNSTGISSITIKFYEAWA